MPWEYTDKVLKLFLDAVHGRPGTHMGEIPEPDGYGEHGSIVCGDALRFSFRVRRHPDNPRLDIITEARYLTFGCTSAIASSEALCCLLEQGERTPIEALKVSNQDLVDFLGGLPEQKIHCSVMGAEALRAAVVDWAKKRGLDVSAELPDLAEEQIEEGRLVCKCFSVTEPYLRRKIRELGLRSIEEITNALKAGGACGSCHYAPGGLQDLLNEIWGLSGQAARMSGEPAVGPREGLSPYRIGKAVEAAIETLVRPQLAVHGGDIELIDIKDELVYCRLTGACADCPSSVNTLKLMVEGKLKEQVDDRLRVIAV